MNSACMQAYDNQEHGHIYATGGLQTPAVRQQRKADLLKGALSAEPSDDDVPLGR
jgi:hypothetical protein